MTEQELVKEILKGWTKESFCQNAYALDAKGDKIHPNERDAVRWCVFGRAYKAAPMMLSLNSDAATAWNKLREDFQTKYGIKTTITVFNDTHTFAEVKEVLENLYKE